MKKKIFALLLAAVLIVPMLALTSCGPQAVEDIDGKTPEEVFSIAMAELDEDARYEVRLGMKTTVKLFIFPVYSIDIPHMVTYSYGKGENEHYFITQEAIEIASKEDVDLLEDSDEELWYVDGWAYCRNGSDKYKLKAESSPIEPSGYEKAVAELLEENAGSVECYRDGDGYYFTVTITEKSELKMDVGEKEVYTVYLTEDGRVSKIVINGYNTSEGLPVESIMTSEYIYDGLSEDITPPEDADSYITKNSGYYW